MTKLRSLLAIALILMVAGTALASPMHGRAAYGGSSTSMGLLSHSGIEFVSVKPFVTNVTITTRSGAVIYSGKPYPGLRIATTERSIIWTGYLDKPRGHHYDAVMFQTY